MKCTRLADIAQSHSPLETTVLNHNPATLCSVAYSHKQVFFKRNVLLATSKLATGNICQQFYRQSNTQTGRVRNCFSPKMFQRKTQYKTTDLTIQRSKPLCAAIYCSLKTNKQKNYNHKGDVILFQGDFDRDSTDLTDFDMKANLVSGLVWSTQY